MTENAIVVIVDALRADRVGQYKGQHITPNINNLLDDAVYFDKAFTTSCTTDPATTSLHTGLHTLSHVLRHHGSRVKHSEKRNIEQVPKLQELLQAADYRTIHKGRYMGRWHYNGFDEITDLEWNNKFWNLYNKYLPERVSDRDGILKSSLDLSYAQLQKIIKTVEPDTANATAQFFNAMPVNQSFYATIHLMDTHIPYTADDSLIDEYQEQFDYDYEPSGSEAYENRFLKDRDTFLEGNETEPTVKRVCAGYDASCTHADQKVGELIDGLRREGVYDDTLLIVVADHGESMYEHEIFFDHHGLYDCTVQVPLIVKPPQDETVATETSSELVQITDIAPTVLDYMGVPAEQCDFDGRSLRPLIEGNCQNWDSRDAVLIEENHAQQRLAVRTDSKKLITFIQEDNKHCRYCDTTHVSTEELYDLRTDEAELNNVIDDRSAEPLRTALVDMKEKFNQKRQDDQDSDNVSYDDEEAVHQRLKDLGYK